MKQNKMIIGITGSIGTGKSTVSNYLISKGYSVVDADKISKGAYNIGSNGYKAILEVFGEEILNSNGEVDRKKIKKIVFDNSNMLQRLNMAIHPIIINEIEKEIEILLESQNVVFLDAPLLIETELHKKVNKIIVVICDKNEQINRIIKRDKITADMAISIINSQMSIDEKLKFADYIVYNNSTIENLYSQVDEIILEIKKEISDV
ncbi:dephospho-CoA kinase [Acetoanaerobium noterae]|uniref:Dephospho-CoA kinase n=1 Tax=Acetoanaerobium noterae TaxID=745369 RepID=A0A1T5CFI1_9FIRM|nr:dephospho-CoA kinase [Acetoanaerobium noterae]SKB58245.1 dephospho-CoA kinase [Acetoanaerobium noterae]